MNRHQRSYHITPLVRARIDECIARDGSLALLRESNRLRDQLRRVFAHGSDAERVELVELGWVSSLRDSDWDDMFALYDEYRQEHNNPQIPRRWRTEDDIPVGEWFHWQKVRVKSGTMSDYQAEAFRAVGADLSTTGPTAQTG